MIKKILTLLLLTVFFTACEKKENFNLVTLPLKKTKCLDFEPSKTGLPLFWAKDFPIQIHKSSSFSEDYQPSLTLAIEIWNSLTGKNLFELVETQNKSETVIEDGMSTLYMYEAWPEDIAKQASTILYAHENNIFEADIVINTKDYIFSDVLAPQNHEIDMVSLLVHELGHVLGLSHTNLEESVMIESLKKGEIRRDLSDADKMSINCIYNYSYFKILFLKL